MSETRGIDDASLTASSVPIDNLFYLVCYAFDAPDSALLVPVGAEQAERPLELLVELLLREVDRLLKRGLTRAYVEERSDIAGIRGRVDFAETTQRMLLEHGKTACVFTSYEADNPPNQVLASTLERLGREPTLSRPLRTRALRLRTRTPARAAFPWRVGAFDKMSVPRQARSYGFALALCRLLANDVLPHTTGEGNQFSEFGGSASWLGTVFERFVLRFWQREAPWIRTRGQRNRTWQMLTGDASDTAYLPALLTDIEFVTPAGRVIVETKCYRTPLAGRYKTKKLRGAHVNQLLAYLGNAVAGGERVGGGMLLYAQVGDPISVDLYWMGRPVLARSVDLANGWAVTRARMLALAREWASLTTEVPRESAIAAMAVEGRA